MKSEKIPEELIEKIRQEADIVDIVSEYVQLKKQGKNYFGLCPFHAEKTPSFSVSPDKQIYYCFGCKAGGNVYSFLMEIESWSFLEAVQYLAEKVGITLPKAANVQGAPDEFSKQQQEMMKMHDLLTKLYHYCLMETDFGKEAFAYLKRRGIAEETIKTFQIGYAPKSWDFAANFLARRGFSLELAVQAGLLTKRSFDGKIFDRFRDRVMFPIRNQKGNTIAFGGRVIHGGEPKYLNSPETPIFNKSQTLFGIDLAREHIREKRQLILFEGYVDVVSAWEAGVKNAIATLGTSLTQEHAARIRRISDAVIICYDSDAAGKAAALKAAELLEQTGCFVKIANMPEGYDPDDYIQKYGGKKFLDDVIAQSLTVMAFKMVEMRRGKNLQDEGDRLQYIKEVLEEISLLPNAVERDHYLRQIADEFSLSLDALKKQHYYIRSQRLKKKKSRLTNEHLGKGLIKKKLLPKHHNAERMLLSYMLKDRDFALRIKERMSGTFHVEEHSALAAYIYAFYATNETSDFRKLLDSIDDKQVLQIATELAQIETKDEISEEELQDYLEVIENYPKWLKIKEKMKEKKEAEQRGDYILAAKITSDIIEMKKTLRQQNKLL